MREEDHKKYDELPPFEPPLKCEAPPPGAFTLFAFEPEEMKSDPKYTSRMMSLDDLKCMTFGSSQDIDGQVFDGHRSVKAQHAAIFFIKNRCFLKAVNGPCTLESMTLYPKLVDDMGKAVKRFTSTGNRKQGVIEPMDPKQRLTREMCVFRLGDSDRRFFVQGTLPLGDGETEELAAGETRERKKEKKDKQRDAERAERRERDDRGDRSRTPRSRSRKRRK
jgi:hypothetical protein